MIFYINIFAKKIGKKWAFLTQNEENANFFTRNCRKSQKIVIITSIPGTNTIVFAFSIDDVSMHVVCAVCAFLNYNVPMHSYWGAAVAQQ
jgi:hypothetical protein